MAYEKARHESLTYSRIARALSADYTFLYYVNLNNGKFKEYSSTSGKLNMDIERQGEDFFNLAVKNIRGQIIIFQHTLYIPSFPW